MKCETVDTYSGAKVISYEPCDPKRDGPLNWMVSFMTPAQLAVKSFPVFAQLKRQPDGSWR